MVGEHVGDRLPGQDAHAVQLAAVPGSVGDFYWGGLGGTYFWGDPKERLVAVWMMQAPGQRTHYRALFRTLVYSALEE
jgi:CubicO group peptidase (beta-lactamase class C family)